MNPQETLAYWIVERDGIYRRRFIQGYDKPWSDDRVFQTVYFCNVQRERDKVTKWIRENYTPDFFGNKYDLSIVAARIFNLPTTLQEIANDIVQFSPERMLEVIHGLQDDKIQVWGGAYLITTHGMKMPKSVYCVNLLEEANQILPLDGVSSCETAHKILMGLDGIGNFLAAQVVADLKNTDGHNLRNAMDWDEFAAPGPGSLRGLNWFWDGYQVTPKNFMSFLRNTRHYLEDSPAAHIVKSICNQDLQNCLCEYDKYMRVKSGKGRSKRKYDGV